MMAANMCATRAPVNDQQIHEGIGLLTCPSLEVSTGHADAHRSNAHQQASDASTVGAGEIQTPIGLQAPAPDAVAAMRRPGSTPGWIDQSAQPLGKDDPLYPRVVEVVRLHGKCSISLVQRLLCIRYNHAATLIQAMEGSVVSFPSDQGERFLLSESGEKGTMDK